MSKTNKERVKPDFRLNPDNIKVNDWVFSNGNVGFVQGVAIDTENMLKFFVLWNNEPPVVGVLAQNLKKLNRPVEVGEINYTIDLDLLVLSPELQQRVKLDKSVVEEYAEAFKNHVKFPPITIWYCTDEEYTGTPLLQPAYLIDGFHRVEAAQIAGITELPFIRKQGTYREALLYSTSINSTHGLRRSNADKRKAVMTLLQDEEWSGWSNREIASHCGVSHQFVNNIRKSIWQPLPDTKLNNPDGSTDTKLNNLRKVKRGGKTYIQDTTNIGKGKSEESPLLDEEKDESEENQSLTNNNLPSPDSTKNDDGGFIPEDNYPEDNRYYPEDVIKDLWDDDEDSFSESLNESVSEDSVKEDSVSKSKSSNVKKTKKPKLEKPQRPQKKEIVIKEGLNYFIRESEDKCRWYVELDKEIYEGLKIYQDRVQAMSVNAAIIRFLEYEGILLRPFPENKIIDEKPSPITSLTNDTRNKLEDFITKHGEYGIRKLWDTES